MTYHYEPGTVRWKRHDGKRDVRLCPPNKGWVREAVLIDRHPTTGKAFKQSQWWFRDEYEGDL